jgi:hypothetical protein
MPMEIVPHELLPPDDDEFLLLLPHPAATIANAATNARAPALLTFKLLPPPGVPNPGCDSILLV